jgi:hypothetical protein
MVCYAASDGNNENIRCRCVRKHFRRSISRDLGGWGELKLPGDKWAIDGSPFE